MKTKLLSIFIVFMAMAMNANAQDFVIADFESDEIGKTYDTYWKWGAENTSKATATVVADPAKPSNKVVNYTSIDWNTGFKALVNLPEGKKLSDYTAFSLDIYIVPSENESEEGPLWKCMDIFLDNTEVMAGANERQAGFSTWTTKQYSLSDFTLSADDLNKSSFTIAFGLNTNCADYYIDNIKLIAPKESEGGYLVLEDFEGKSIDDSYAVQTYGEGQAVATIIADPEDSNNKVVNLVTSGWDPRVKVDVILPEGKMLGDYDAILADIYFPTNPNDEWSNFKQFVISIDNEFIYKSDGYPKLGNIDTWTTMTYPLSETTITDEQKTKSSFSLEMGVNSNNANYHMDNIMLKEKGTGIIQTLSKVVKVIVQNGMLIFGGEEASDVEIYDIKGAPCMTANNVSSIDIAGLSRGIYIVKVKSEGKTYVSKIVK